MRPLWRLGGGGGGEPERMQRVREIHTQPPHISVVFGGSRYAKQTKGR